MNQANRCSWVSERQDDDAMLLYHDQEWGVPQHDGRALFELLTLEGAQAGLSWETILRRRQGYRDAFLSFDIQLVASLTPEDQARLLRDPGIIRNAAKVAATVKNAAATLRVIDEFGSLDAFLWSFVSGVPLQNHFRSLDQLPASTPKLESMSKQLRQRGFGFVGPTICYALMQAAGLVNDHTLDCFRHAEVATIASS